MLLGRKERRIFYGKEAMCVRTKVRLSKSILRERERESISLTLAFMTFFVLKGRVTEIGKKIKKTKDGKLI
jgi:hypothetical protein